MVRVEASLLQKRAHGRARPPGRSSLGHASEGWPQAGAGRGKRGRENQRHRDLAGGIARSHGPPSFPATCAPRPTTSPTRFLRFNLEESWTAAQRRVERCRGEPGARLAPDSGGGCSERPGIPPPGQGARTGSLGPPQKGPGPAGARSPLPAPARGLPPAGTGRGPQTPLAEAAAGGARVGRPPRRTRGWRWLWFQAAPAGARVGGRHPGATPVPLSTPISASRLRGRVAPPWSKRRTSGTSEACCCRAPHGTSSVTSHVCARKTTRGEG